MVINGILLYFLSTLCKYIFIKDNSQGLNKILNAFNIALKKGNPAVIVSATQLFGLCWLLIGLVENVLGDSIKNIPEIVLYAGEVLIPTVLFVVVLKIINK